VVRGQTYILVAFEPYQRKDGSRTKLAHWESSCAECAMPFDCFSPWTAPPQRRRCDAHRAPGKWVEQRAARDPTTGRFLARTAS
jgi:hypothetical protein